jgi:hypothetical protein
MASLDYATINVILSDSRFLAAFPELMATKRRVAEISQKDTASGGCCGGGAVATDPTEVLRPILSDLKRTVATWPKARTDEFLRLLNQKSLQVTYRDSNMSAVKTVVITR